MPRNLSTAANNYTGPILWLAEITTRKGNKHYFAEDRVLFGGITYQPYLRVTEGPRFTRSLRADAAEIELLNADLFVGALLQQEGFEGALCDLQQFLLGIEQAVLVFRGRLTEQEEIDQAVRFRLVSELDPAQLSVHARLYAQLCTWRFRQKPCGYLPDQISVTENLAERTADIFSTATIGDSALAETANAHTDRVVVLTAGTGRGQKRRIKSNTATTFAFYHPWDTTPDGTTKFKVFSFANGAPKLLFTATSALLEAPGNIGTVRTIGNNTLAMLTDEHADDLVIIASGPLTGQMRRLKSNSATLLALANDQPDLVFGFNDLFRVVHRRCSKDFAPSCEDRARTESFNGFPTLVPIVQRAFRSNFPPPGFDPGGGRRGGDIPILL